MVVLLPLSVADEDSTADKRSTESQKEGSHVFNDNGSFLLALFEFFLFFASFMCLF